MSQRSGSSKPGTDPPGPPPLKKKAPVYQRLTDPSSSSSANRIRVTNVRVKKASPSVIQRKTTVIDGPPTLQPSAQDTSPQDPRVGDLEADVSMMDAENVDMVLEDELPSKKQKNTNTSKLQEWLQYRDETLDELLTLEGLGPATNTELICFTCASPNAIYRCFDCFPRSLLQCKRCILSNHARQPLHEIRVWNERFFEKVSLNELGLRIQLGHNGLSCPCPKPGPSDFVVFNARGYTRINVDYCDCFFPRPPPPRVQLLRAGWFPATTERPSTAFTFDVLDLFEKITLQGKMTIYDFYHTLLHRTDHLQLSNPVYRYPEFQRVFRIWRHLRVLKRAGRAHDPLGTEATPRGTLALECPACPQPGKNLPTNWREFPPELKFLFTLYLAIDANFKLKNKERGITDVELDPGFSHYVEQSEYQSHLAQYTSEQEFNSCSSDHDAIARSNSSVPGYGVNGVAMTICARHSLVRPNGAVDLPKGERYCSIDYMILSTLVGISLLRVVVSYDIGCQWSKNFKERMNNYRPDMQIPASTSVEIGIPSWHANGHGVFCRNNYSLNILPGVGRTCGEDIETCWSQTNALAPSTREMGPGNRHETLNAHWNHWNFQKIIGFRALFLKRFKKAIANKKSSHDQFLLLSSTFASTTISQWTNTLEKWESNRLHLPSPYDEPEKVTTIQDVRLDLAKQEAADMAKGVISPHISSVAEFLVKGMELEEQQRKLQYETSHSKQQSVKSIADLELKRNSLHRRILQWREVQVVHMPFLEHENESLSSISAESIPLHLPSSISPALHTSPLVASLIQKEVALRIAQASDSLHRIRQGRCMITTLTIYKQKNVSGAGNRMMTRLRSDLSRYSTQIQHAAATYSAAFNILQKLDPTSLSSLHYQELQAADIRGPGRGVDEDKQKKYDISWIWLVGKRDTGDGDMTQSLRVEWMKCRARYQRWREEYDLVKEEMRRTVAYLEWKGQWWRSIGDIRDCSSELHGGLVAYAERQADQMNRLAISCLQTWVPVLEGEGEKVEWAKKYGIKFDGSTLVGKGKGIQEVDEDEEVGSEDETDDDVENFGL